MVNHENFKYVYAHTLRGCEFNLHYEQMYEILYSVFVILAFLGKKMFTLENEDEKSELNGKSLINYWNSKTLVDNGKKMVC